MITQSSAALCMVTQMPDSQDAVGESFLLVMVPDFVRDSLCSGVEEMNWMISLEHLLSQQSFSILMFILACCH